MVHVNVHPSTQTRGKARVNALVGCNLVYVGVCDLGLSELKYGARNPIPLVACEFDYGVMGLSTCCDYFKVINLHYQLFKSQKFISMAGKPSVESCNLHIFLLKCAV